VDQRADGVTTESDPSGRWRQLAVLSTAMVLAMVPWFSTAAVLPQLRDAWGMSRVAGSWLTIAVQIGFVLGALASALVNLADRVAPRRLILIGSGIAALANVMPAVVDAYGPTLVARLLTGAALALVYPPAMKAMSTWFRMERGLALGAMVGALTIGSGLPHFVNGVGGVSWRTVLVVTSILTLTGGIVADRFGVDGPYSYPAAPFVPRAVRDAFANRRVRLATLGYFGHMWELYAMWSWFGAFYVDVLISSGDSDPSRHASLVTAAVIGGGGVGSLWAGRVSDRLSREFAAGAPMIVSGGVAVFIGFLQHGSPVLVAVLGLVWGLSVVADSAQFSTIVTEEADQRFVGTSLTVQLASGFVLTVATIFFVPVIRDAWGWGWAFAFLAPGPMVGAWAMKALDNDRNADDIERDVPAAR